MGIAERIAERAYHMWLKRPQSDAARNWLEAEREELRLLLDIPNRGIGAATGPRASFHFQRLLIELEVHSTAVFDQADDHLLFDSSWAPVLIHELVHYVQAMTTVLGQSILMNWFAVAIGTAKALNRVVPLRLPLQRGARSDQRIASANQILDEYFAEANALAGAGIPLRPHREASQHAPFSLYQYSWPHPRDGSTTPGIAASFRTEGTPEGSAIGVPLLGDAFTEGMARVAQRLCAREAIDASLSPISRDPRIYYTAIYRLIRARLLGWDAALLTLVLTDAALCSRTPGATFWRLFEICASRQPPPTDDDYFALRRELQQHPDLKAGASFILAEIQIAESGIPQGHEFGQLFRHVLGVFRRAWQARARDGAVFLDTEYRTGFVDRMVDLIGAPPIVFADRAHVIRIAADPELERACHALRASYDVLLALRAPDSSECSLLRSKACRSKKGPACRTNVLEVPILTDASACAMVFAAQQLQLHQRPLERF